MTTNSIKLLRRLNPFSAKALEAAALLCQTRAHSEITIEHWLLKLLELGEGDISVIARRYDIDLDSIWRDLLEHLDTLPRSIETKPSLSSGVLELIKNAWLEASIDDTENTIRSYHLLFAMVNSPKLIKANNIWPLLSITTSQLSRLLPMLDERSEEASEEFNSIQQTEASLQANFDTRSQGALNPKSESDTQENNTSSSIKEAQDKASLALLNKFTVDVTQKAKDGNIDPVFGREVEIRQMIDILSRRRKNNPILVGEPGVGKTALVEGLALRIAQGDVPESLKQVVIRNLDLGILQAGAGVKGEFEQRLKNIIEAIQHSNTPVLLFIDEAHTIIGAGNQAGGADAANLLKPALARGELRTIAATTWSEYKQYFEKDAALERRFQPVKVDEPDDEKACLMLRGLKERYSKYHGVHVTDEAVKTAVQLSRRYLTGRQLPDKAVDLLDTACARVRMSLDASPELILQSKARLASLEMEKQALEEDSGLRPSNYTQRIEELTECIQNEKIFFDETQQQFENEKEIVNQILSARTMGESLSTIEELMLRLSEIQGKNPLISIDVDTKSVANVISDWTGVPLSSLMKNEQEHLLMLESHLSQRVIGQDSALYSLSQSIRSAKAGLSSDRGPLGVFLLVGPSGIGKTETALAIADQLYGGESSLITINMSEYQEAHTVSQLKGSPPGYVGYGQGGILTEAVRKKPYSVVLLDEVEKAHKDVLNLFYQVFDRGILRDGEGREIDFKETLILMTSNLGSDELMALFEHNPQATNAEQHELIRPILTNHFQPALLARFQTIIYTPLLSDALKKITLLKMNSVKKRLFQYYGLQMVTSEAFIDMLVDACMLPDTGARNIDSLLNQQILPILAQRLLANKTTDYTIILFDYSATENIVIDFYRSLDEIEYLVQETEILEDMPSEKQETD